MDAKLVPGGVYRHYKGDFYVVLFEAQSVSGVEKADMTVAVTVDSGGDHGVLGPFVDPPARLSQGEKLLFEARTHGPLSPRERVAVYVPLYTHKPGRRISVRPVADFFEAIEDDRCGGSFRHDYTLKIPGREIEPVEYGDGIQRCRSCSKKQPFNFNGNSRTYARFAYVGTEIPR